MTNIVTIYYSGYGHTKKQAEAVREGTASVPGVNAHIVLINSEGNIEESDWQLLDEADAIIFGSPTYMGMVSWQFKKFADATSERWFAQKWKDKIAAGFTNSSGMSGDKLSTLHYMSTLALQHAMIWVGNSTRGISSKDAQRNSLNYFGSFAGLMAQSPSDAGPEEAPPPGDLATAKLFGERVAIATKQWKGQHRLEMSALS